MRLWMSCLEAAPLQTEGEKHPCFGFSPGLRAAAGPILGSRTCWWQDHVYSVSADAEAGFSEEPLMVPLLGHV